MISASPTNFPSLPKSVQSIKELLPMPPSSASPVTPERIQQFAWAMCPPLCSKLPCTIGSLMCLMQAPNPGRGAGRNWSVYARFEAIMNALVGLACWRRTRRTCTPDSESSTFLVSFKPALWELDSAYEFSTRAKVAPSKQDRGDRQAGCTGQPGGDRRRLLSPVCGGHLSHELSSAQTLARTLTSIKGRSQ